MKGDDDKNSNLVEIKKTRKIKIALIGKTGIGKSAVILRFKDDIFVEFINPTNETIHRKSFSYQNEDIELEMLDLDANNENTMNTLGIHGYILCYSIDNRQSFDEINAIYDKICNSSVDIPKIIIGNKSDLQNQRIILYEEGKNLAEKLNCPFIECSSKSSFNIQKLFHMIIVEIDNLEIKRTNVENRCPNLLKYFVKNKQKIKIIFYVTIIFNIIINTGYFILGFIQGFSNYDTIEDLVIVGLVLFLGLWNFLFLLIGYYGLFNKKQEYSNYFKKSIIISILIEIILILIYTYLIYLNSKQDLMKYLYPIIISNIFVQVSIILNEFVNLFFAYLFQLIETNDV